MDRALRFEDLADALGQHPIGALPTAQELIDLIAEVEVRAFIGADDIDEQLLRSAWYLHGVASAVNAENLYTRVRQQRAFRVSAHIFDVALNGTERLAHEQLTLAFAAQVGYRRSDLDPNATAIWRRVNALLDYATGEESAIPEGQDANTEDEASQHMPADPFDPAVADQFPSARNRDSPVVSASRQFRMMALRAGVAFLGLDIARINDLTALWRRDINMLTDATGLESLRTTMFGPAERVVVAVSELVQFLRYGDRNSLEAARTALDEVLNLSAGQDDHDARWVAAHLRPIVDDMDSSSVWTVFPDDSPDALAQAFTVGTPPVLTLWPPQRDLLMRQNLNPLDPSTRRLLLSVPTSAGKTLLAQIMICHHLATASGDVCYVTPLRSLGREMRQALASRLRVLRRGLGDDLPDFTTLTTEEILAFLGTPETSTVEVMTPERLAHMLRRDPVGVLDRFSMFVIDEAHLMAQPGRGFLLESLLSLLSTTPARLVLLSGVMGNAPHVAAWLDDSSAEVLFNSDWRGPRRLHGLLYSAIVWDDERLTTTKSVKFPTRATYPVIGDLRIRPAESKVRNLATSRERPLGQKVFDVSPLGERRNHATSTPFYKLCAKASYSLLPAGSLLMIVSRRDYARGAAQTLAEMLPESPKTTDLLDFFTDRLGAEHPLVDCARHGVAYHHAGLPVDVLDAIEQGVRDERIDALVATTTLTDGVNLPVRTVLICETTYAGQDPGQQLDPSRLLNAVGRAGRAGRETEGWIVLALQKGAELADFDRLRPAADDLEIRSTLDSDEALERLAEAEALIASSADAIFELEPGEAADFSAFVWFVFSAYERLQQIPGSPNIAESVRGLLAFTQLTPELRERWRALATVVGEKYLSTAETSRLRWTTCGTTLGSARRLEQIAQLVAQRTAELHPDPLDPDASGPAPDVSDAPASLAVPVEDELALPDAMAVFSATGCFGLLLGLPEAERTWRFKRSPGAHERLSVAVLPGLQAWLSGADVTTLANVMIPDVPDLSWRLEQTVDAVSSAFEHFLAWTVGVLVEQANEFLTDAGKGVRLPRQLSSMIRYGVDTEQAITLLTKGVRSRRLAYVVGQKAAHRDYAGTDLIDWLRTMHLEGWRAEFAATDREVEDLIEFSRESSESLLRQLLETGSAESDLRYPMTPAPPTLQPVEVRMGPDHDPIEVWTLGDHPYRVGLIAAAHHADVILLRKVGITISALTNGTTVTLRDAR